MLCVNISSHNHEQHWITNSYTFWLVYEWERLYNHICKYENKPHYNYRPRFVYLSQVTQNVNLLDLHTRNNHITISFVLKRRILIWPFIRKHTRNTTNLNTTFFIYCQFIFRTRNMITCITFSVLFSPVEKTLSVVSFRGSISGVGLLPFLFGRLY